MQKIILITGSTDGIGLETAKKLVTMEHHLVLHGRNPQKLEAVASDLSKIGSVEKYIADLSDMNDVRALAKAIHDKHETLDVLINNAGVLNAPNALTTDGLDVRFAVNTVAPYLLTQELLEILGSGGRVINLSSAAQAPVDLDALTGKRTGLDTMEAYSQSKLAITMWSRAIANAGPVVIAVNPGSLLGSKMVKDGFGIDGKDISIGVDILVHLATCAEFSDKTGLYFDNDKGRFADPHPDGLDDQKCEDVLQTLDNILV